MKQKIYKDHKHGSLLCSLTVTVSHMLCLQLLPLPTVPEGSTAGESSGKKREKHCACPEHPPPGTVRAAAEEMLVQRKIISRMFAEQTSGPSRLCDSAGYPPVLLLLILLLLCCSLGGRRRRRDTLKRREWGWMQLYQSQVAADDPVQTSLL